MKIRLTPQTLARSDRDRHMDQTEQVQSYSGARLVPLSEIRDKRLRMALALWEDKRQARNYPSRAEMTPRNMAPFLRYITLWRRTDDGTDYEYRIMGDAYTAAYGRTMTGRRVSDLDTLRPGNGARVKAVLDHVVRNAKPAVSVGWFTTSSGKSVYHEMIFLPLGPDDATVDHVLGVSVHSAS